jgi:hypothetical protein
MITAAESAVFFKGTHLPAVQVYAAVLFPEFPQELQDNKFPTQLVRRIQTNHVRLFYGSEDTCTSVFLLKRNVCNLLDQRYLKLACVL